MYSKSSVVAWEFSQVARFKWLLVMLLVGFFIPSFASNNTQFKSLFNEERLGSLSVNHLIQRHDGFIWMGTAEGLSRYDGFDFINHRSFPNNPNSLPNSWVNWLLEDHQHQLWVGTAIGLARLKNNEIDFEQYLFAASNPNSISGNNIAHLFEDNQNRLWIATGMGLSLYRPQSNDFQNFYIDPNDQEGETNHINVIDQKDENHLWLGNAKGLYLFNIKTGQFTKQNLSVENFDQMELMDLAVDQKGRLWVVTANHGVFRLDTQSGQITAFRHRKNDPNSITSDELWSVMLDSRGHIWLTSWGDGISQIMPDDQVLRHQHIRGDDRSIPSDFTTTTLEDDAGLIWAATFNGVAIHQPSNPVENIRPIAGVTESLSSQMVWSFAESDEAIWVGTAEGLNRWDKSTGSIQRFFSRDQEQADQKPMVSVWNITQINNQTFMLGTDQGLAKFDLTTQELTHFHTINSAAQSSEDIKKMLKQEVWIVSPNAEGLMWVGTNNASVYQIDTKFNILKNLSPLIKDSLGGYENFEITNLIEDDQQNLWISTANGMYFYNQQQDTIKTVRDQTGQALFDKDWIMSIKQHWNNQYWVASQFNGLNLLQLNSDGTVRQMLRLDQSQPNITDRSIYTIFPINEHEIWFTGRRNVYHLDLDTKQVTNYGSSYFEPNTTIHENSQFIGANNQLYLGSNRGAIKFDQNAIKTSKKKLKIYFTGIKSNSLNVATHLNSEDFTLNRSSTESIRTQVAIHNLDHFTFPYQDVFFNFKFAALDYFNADNIQYAYRIPQLAEQWIDLYNTNELTLTNLEAGDYTLEVKATNTGYQWSDEITSLQFILEPKPWLTWWAKSLYVLLAGLLGLMVFMFYRKHLITKYALRHREVQLSQAIWGSGDELWEWNIEQQKISRTNSAELTDDRVRTFSGSFDGNDLKIHPDDIANLQRKIDNILDGSSDEFDAVYRQKNKQGQWVWIQDKARVTSFSPDHKPLVVNGISRNISSIKETEQRSILIASAFQSSSDGAVVLDADFKIISINAAFTAITGYDERIINKFMPWRSGPISTDNMQSSELFQMISQVVTQGGSYHEEVMITTVDQRLIPIDLRVNCIYNDKKEPSHYIATITDITYRKDTEEELKQLANYDSLTGLPNRSLMTIQLNKALQEAEKKGNKMAVMFVDLDHFKNINDSLGHSIGDELLIAAAKRLTHCIRKSDMVARIGGDEFTISLLNYDNISDVIRVAEKVLKEMAKPFKLTNHELIITPSIGIATYNGDDIDTETLLMQADTAMYHAKRSGRNNFQFFTDSMNEAVLNRVDIEMRLRKALKNNELALHFQPKFNLKSGQISGFEALIRWHEGEKDLIPPDDFIPIAEETGLITSIGQFVLESACQQLHEWQQSGHQHIHVAINLSAVQFMDKNLVVMVSRILDRYQITPYSLELEITESTLIENLQYTIKTLHELRTLGVKLSLDDFGTGFSSLNYLKQFPIHALKIDRSFIKDIDTDQRDASMVESIINLAHNLSIEVVAEGVETLSQLDLLAAYQIEEVQGFLLSKPFDVIDATSFLHSNQSISSIVEQINPKLAQNE